jgi:hypothetical protein
MTAVGRIAAAPLPTTAPSDASAAASGEDRAAFGSILSQMDGNAGRSDTAASAKSGGSAHRGEKDGREALQDGKAGLHRRGLHERMIGDGGDAVHAGHKANSLAAEMPMPADGDTAAAIQAAAPTPTMPLAGMNAPPMPDEPTVPAPENLLTKEVAGAIARDAQSGPTPMLQKTGDGPAEKDARATGTKAAGFAMETRATPQPSEAHAQSLPEAPAAARADVTVLGRETHLAPARPAGVKPAAAPEPDEADDAAVPKDAGGRTAKSQGLPPELHATKVPAVGKGTDGAAGDHDAPAQAAASTTTSTAATGGGLPLPTLHRIAGAIADTAAGASSSPVPATAAMPSAQVAASGPIKVLTVRLDLAGRGALDVRMIADGSALTIHVRTEKDETARHLHNDRDELTSLLRGAGYDANIATIESRRADAGPGPSGQPAALGPAGTPNGDQGGGTFQEPRQQGREGGAFPFSDQRETSHDTSKPDSRGAGLLYV